MSDSTTNETGQLCFADGNTEQMDETHLNRVVYALTTMALHDAIRYVQITEAKNGKGVVLWRHPNHLELTG